MQRPQFGQRGITVNGEPVNVAASVARSVSQHSSGRLSPGMIAIGMAFVTIFLVWLEALVSSTSIITPVNQLLLWGTRGLGMIAAFLGTLAVTMSVTNVPLIHRGLTVVFLPLVFGYFCGGIAYRIADWTEFGLSNQPFEQAQYPIESISHGRRGARSTIQIDPFDTGDRTDIPVTTDQYHVLVKSSADSCVTVMQRKSPSGAIEIQTNGRYMLRTPDEVPVARCGFTAPSARSAASDSANPWSKD